MVSAEAEKMFWLRQLEEVVIKAARPGLDACAVCGRREPDLSDAKISSGAESGEGGSR